MGNDGIDRTDYAAELRQAEAAQAAQGVDRRRRFTPIAGVDFDVNHQPINNYQPINSLYPTAAPGSYVARGNTLQGLP